MNCDKNLAQVYAYLAEKAKETALLKQNLAENQAKMIESIRRRNLKTTMQGHVIKTPATLGNVIKYKCFTKLEELVLSRLVHDEVKRLGHRMPDHYMYRLPCMVEAGYPLLMNLYTTACPDCDLHIRCCTYFDKFGARDEMTEPFSKTSLTYCNRIACMK